MDCAETESKLVLDPCSPPGFRGLNHFGNERVKGGMKQTFPTVPSGNFTNCRAESLALLKQGQGMNINHSALNLLHDLSIHLFWCCGLILMMCWAMAFCRSVPWRNLPGWNLFHSRASWKLHSHWKILRGCQGTSNSCLELYECTALPPWYDKALDKALSMLRGVLHVIIWELCSLSVYIMHFWDASAVFNAVIKLKWVWTMCCIKSILLVYCHVAF